MAWYDGYGSNDFDDFLGREVTLEHLVELKDNLESGAPRGNVNEDYGIFYKGHPSKPFVYDRVEKTTVALGIHGKEPFIIKLEYKIEDLEERRELVRDDLVQFLESYIPEPEDINEIRESYVGDPEYERRGFGGPSYGHVCGDNVYLTKAGDNDILFQKADCVAFDLTAYEDAGGDVGDVLDKYLRKFHTNDYCWADHLHNEYVASKD